MKPNPDLASPWLQRNDALRGACASVGGGRCMPWGENSTLSLHKILQPKRKMYARGDSGSRGNNSVMSSWSAAGHSPRAGGLWKQRLSSLLKATPLTPTMLFHRACSQPLFDSAVGFERRGGVCHCQWRAIWDPG